MADDVLRQGIQGISELITIPGLINLDFADVRSVMAEGGSALMAIGQAQRRQPGAARRRAGDPQRAARRQHRRRPGHPLQRHRRPGPEPVRGQRGGRDHPPHRRPGCQHHLRRGHRPGHEGRHPHHRDRHRLRRRQRAASCRRAMTARPWSSRSAPTIATTWTSRRSCGARASSRHSRSDRTSLYTLPPAPRADGLRMGVGAVTGQLGIPIRS